MNTKTIIIAIISFVGFMVALILYGLPAMLNAT